MISDARGGHVSPGVYTEVRDVTYSTKSLGITTLGVAGETLKGPAFQPISIASWTDFVDYFGGTSPIRFKGTNYPKYELPYVAKAYLEESKQLEVVRVLGLSGYWAGKAWIVRAEGKDRIEIQLLDLRIAEGQLGDGHDGLRERSIVDGLAAPRALEQFVRSDAVHHDPGLVQFHGGHAEHHVFQHLGVDAAETEYHDRTEGWVAHEADDDFMLSLAHRRDNRTAEILARADSG